MLHFKKQKKKKKGWQWMMWTRHKKRPTQKGNFHIFSFSLEQKHIPNFQTVREILHLCEEFQTKWITQEMDRVLCSTRYYKLIIEEHTPCYNYYLTAIEPTKIVEYKALRFCDQFQLKKATWKVNNEKIFHPDFHERTDYLGVIKTRN